MLAALSLWLFVVIEPDDFTFPAERHIEAGFETPAACEARRVELVDAAFARLRTAGAGDGLTLVTRMRCIDAADPALGDFEAMLKRPDPST